MLADYRVAKGKIIDLDVEQYGLKGKYLISKCSHSITNKDAVKITITRYDKG